MERHLVHDELRVRWRCSRCVQGVRRFGDVPADDQPGQQLRHHLTRTGNSPPPTSGVPGYMGVIVASKVVKDKTGNVTGVWGKVVVVKTDAGYSPSPGHPGTGKIVATFCG